MKRMCFLVFAAAAIVVLASSIGYAQKARIAPVQPEATPDDATPPPDPCSPAVTRARIAPVQPESPPPEPCTPPVDTCCCCKWVCQRVCCVKRGLFGRCRIKCRYVWVLVPCCTDTGGDTPTPAGGNTSITREPNPSASGTDNPPVTAKRK